jgi:hypothetical protein
LRSIRGLEKKGKGRKRKEKKRRGKTLLQCNEGLLRVKVWHSKAKQSRGHDKTGDWNLLLCLGFCKQGKDKYGK